MAAVPASATHLHVVRIVQSPSMAKVDAAGWPALPENRAGTLVVLRIAQRDRQRIVAVIVERGPQQVAQRLAGAGQPDAQRAGAGLEDLGERGDVEVVPVAQLE